MLRYNPMRREKKKRRKISSICVFFEFSFLFVAHTVIYSNEFKLIFLQGEKGWLLLALNARYTVMNIKIITQLETMDV